MNIQRKLIESYHIMDVTDKIQQMTVCPNYKVTNLLFTLKAYTAKE